MHTCHLHVAWDAQANGVLLWNQISLSKESWFFRARCYVLQKRFDKPTEIPMGAFNIPSRQRRTIALCSLVSKGRLPSVRDNSFHDDAIKIDKQRTSSNVIGNVYAEYLSAPPCFTQMRSTVCEAGIRKPVHVDCTHCRHQAHFLTATPNPRDPSPCCPPFRPFWWWKCRAFISSSWIAFLSWCLMGWSSTWDASTRMQGKAVQHSRPHCTIMLYGIHLCCTFFYTQKRPTANSRRLIRCQSPSSWREISAWFAHANKTIIHGFSQNTQDQWYSRFVPREHANVSSSRLLHLP
jgi:hypothetical protein